MLKTHFTPRLLLPLALAAAAVCLQTAARAQTAAPFSQIIVFGDSLSDVGNVADLANDAAGVRYPGSDFNYTDGRFTDGTDTDPAATLYSGVWHEQLAKLFLNMPVATATLDGGTDYAYGGAVTGEGQTVFTEATLSIHIDNVGRQVATFVDALNGQPADGSALYIVWAGANDLFGADDAATVTAAATNEAAHVQRLAENGARFFLVPNVPPLGLTPDGGGDAALTQAASDFRDQLNSDLDATVSTLAAETPPITVTIYRLDVFGLFQRLLANQYTYGFTDIVDPSQGSGTDPDMSLFWDGKHPTTAGHFQLAAEAYTVLTGVPVVETYKKQDNTGFYLTRTGTDVSTKLLVNYALGGTASDGTAITPVKATKKLKPGKQFTELDVTPATGQTVETFKLKPGATYELPVVKKAKIKLD